MNIADVMDELGVALGAIPDLRVQPYNADRITPPGAIVGWPDPREFDTAMSRGGDRLTIPVFVIVGKYDARTTRDRMAKYLDGAGEASVKAALESHTYTACDSVRVTEATVDGYSLTGLTGAYLGAEFTVDVLGPGGS